MEFRPGPLQRFHANLDLLFQCTFYVFEVAQYPQPLKSLPGSQGQELHHNVGGSEPGGFYLSLSHLAINQNIFYSVLYCFSYC